MTDLKVPRAISPARAAQMIGCSQSSITHMIRDGRLRGVQDRPGAWWKIDYDSIQEYLQRRDAALRCRSEAAQPMTRKDAQINFNVCVFKEADLFTVRFTRGDQVHDETSSTKDEAMEKMRAWLRENRPHPFVRVVPARGICLKCGAPRERCCC